MNRRSTLLTIFSVLSLAACHEHVIYAQQSIAGKWALTMDTPHGVASGELDLQQEGSKISGTCTAGQFGTLPLSGAVEGKKVSFNIAMQGGEMHFGFSGTIDGNKMSGTTQMDGKWSATRKETQAAAAKSLLATVTAFKPESLVVSPGETGLAKAKPAKPSDIKLGDRVLVSFVEGMTEARRIVLVAADDIARRNESERADWQQRGVSGIVASAANGVVTLEQRTPQGVKTTTLTVNGKTKIRRYAPDSVKFTDAQPARLADIAPGDQAQARGRKSDDGAQIAAEDIVFGTFLTKLGAVTAVNAEAHEIRVEELGTKKPLTIRVTAASQLKMLPDMRKMQPAHGHDAASFDIKQMLQQMPAATLGDVKVGSVIVVTSTRGTNSGELTAIMLLANADSLVQLAQSMAPGESPAQAISSMHGGMLGGPGGLSLPAILQ